MSRRLLAASHACVVDINQQLFLEMSHDGRFEIELVIPESWPVGGKWQRHGVIAGAGSGLRLKPLPVVLAGQLSLHFYRARIPGPYPDVVLVDEQAWSLSALQLALIAKRACAKLVLTAEQNLYKRYPPPFAWIERFVMSQAAGIFPTNEGAAEVLRKKGYSGPLEVVPHGVDLALFTPGREDQLRAELGLQGTVMGYMGRLVPEKGVDLLIEAWRALAERADLPAWSGVIVGSGPERERLGEAIAAAGLDDRVRLLDAVAHGDAGRYMRCLDVLVLPSRTAAHWKEQFGRVLIEALAAEKAVVGSDSGNIPFLIDETAGGLVFPEGDAAGLAESVAKLLLDDQLRCRMGRSGAEVVRQRYDVRAVARRLGQALEDLAA